MYDNIILIPFRNREKHLNYFIQNTIPLIEKHMPNTLIVIIEQNEGNLFNRGCILNIGFKEYQNKTKYFITQDIDINPKKDCLVKYYNKDVNNIISGILISPCITLGGIIKISSENIFKLNGFPNDIWGWGSEDKALENRRLFFNIEREIIFLHHKKNINNENFICFDNVNDRKTLNHQKNHQFHYIDYNNLDSKQKKEIIFNSGLNNISYQILEKRKINQMLEIIKVKI
jgi:hypothetical protein